MSETDPKKDYRYTLGDLEIEGYQITPQTRWLNQYWPPWLNMQRLPDEPNSVFSMSDSPDRLWLSLPTGDVELPELAWIVQHTDGHLAIVDALDFEEYKKVVPIPAPAVHAPADGIPDAANVTALKPVATLENLAGDTTEMRAEMMSAIKLLQEEDKAEEALDYLILCVSRRTRWCNCPPGVCSQEDDAGCRINSPLVKIGN